MKMPKQKGLVPPLRFPEFRDAGPWEVKRLGEVSEVLDSMRRPVASGKRNPGPYPYYGASGIIDYIDDYIFDERLLLIGEDGAKWGPFEKTAFIVEGKYWVNNHAHVLRPFAINDVLLENYLNAIDTAIYVTGAAPPKLTLDNLKSIRIPVPPAEKEQQKIADCLSSLDELIQAEEKALEALKQHKKGLMQQLFPAPRETTPKLRFPEFRDAGPWEVKELGDALDYQQPGPFIVSSDQYKKNGTPVLTAGKTFILGYTTEDYGIYESVPVIIFDDFTTESKFVDFPFKVKSSAIKILTARSGYSIKFVYEAMSLIKFNATQHKRYWISEYQHLKIPFPKLEEQQKIADCFSSLDKLIQAKSKRIEALKQHKKGLLQNLFPREIV